ncbi:MAG TPA: molybdopterin-dependent oxidoreductase [Hyphomicrobiaceae bacterium]|jgi:DMSO/TMAO reductase YedYZ molybdopterin-dependent catalytic subunit|nr:molybdopterin-dependent oxidoreductase [Hyphomicrobiaceae bacterium]
MSGERKAIPGVDARLLVKDAARLLPDPSRRLFLRNGASIGALALLTGCSISDSGSAERVLRRISEFNDWVQARLFSPHRLAQTYPDSAVTRPFRFNAYYAEEDAPDVDEDSYRLIVDGLIERKEAWTLDQLNALPQETQITRLVCVEGWSAIGKWTGVPLRTFLERIGADLTARYVHFACAEGYSSSIDMPTALHPQTQMTLKFDGQVLPTKFGFPLRIRIPTKLGFKNPKHVVGLSVVNQYPGGYWEDQGYNWFSGL